MKQTTLALCAAALILFPTIASGDELPFANYGTLTLVDQPVPGTLNWNGEFASGPWDWFPSESPPLPGWDGNATQQWEMQITSEFSVDENLLATASFSTLTNIVSIENGEIVGSLVLNEIAESGLIDLNAAHATVDEESGTILLPSGSELDEVRAITQVTLVEATGRFADLVQIGPWRGYYVGHYVKPLQPELDLQQNILESPFIGGSFEFAVTGAYAVPEPSALVLLLSGLIAIHGVRRQR